MLTRAAEHAYPALHPGSTPAGPLLAAGNDGLLDLSRRERYLAAVALLLADTLAGIAVRLDRRPSRDDQHRSVGLSTEVGVVSLAGR